MKNTLLVLLSLIMIVFSSSAFAKKVEEMPVYRDGLFYEYFSPNLANGQYEKYFANGQLRDRKTYKDGKENGPSEIYHENGQINKERQYGLYESNIYPGTLSSRCFYFNGEMYEC